MLATRRLSLHALRLGRNVPNGQVTAMATVPHLDVGTPARTETSTFQPQQQHRTFAVLSAAQAFKQKQEKEKRDRLAAKNQESSRDRNLDLVLQSIDAKPLEEPPISDEEKERRVQIMKAYRIGMAEQHNYISHDLARKIRMKKHAKNLLPKGTKMREEALKIDTTIRPPKWRRFATWTPPIPGFTRDMIRSETEA